MKWKIYLVMVILFLDGVIHNFQESFVLKGKFRFLMVSSVCLN